MLRIIKKDEDHLILSGRVMIDTVEDLHESFTEMLTTIDQSCSLFLNMAEVEEMDTAGVQTLLALKRRMANGALQFVGLRSHVQSRLKTLGLLENFNE